VLGGKGLGFVGGVLVEGWWKGWGIVGHLDVGWGIVKVSLGPELLRDRVENGDVTGWEARTYRDGLPSFTCARKKRRIGFWGPAVTRGVAVTYACF
jgi:hypothetical protein